MERLTLDNAIKYIKEVARKNRINKEKNTIIIPNSFISSNDCADKYGQVARWLERLKDYDDLEEKGLLFELPCKVGDLVFIISGENICGRKVKSIKILSTEIEFSTSDFIFRKESFGETVFLTRAEATKKLYEMEEQNG